MTTKEIVLTNELSSKLIKLLNKMTEFEISGDIHAYGEAWEQYQKEKAHANEIAIREIGKPIFD